MPSQQQREFELTLPSVNENPAERRRILNILAQRRYRDRKRARLAKLEAQARQAPPDSAESLSPQGHLQQSPLQTVEELRATAKAIKREGLNVISGSTSPAILNTTAAPPWPSPYGENLASNPTSPVHCQATMIPASKSLYDQQFSVNVLTQADIYPSIPAYNPFPSPPYSQQHVAYDPNCLSPQNTLSLSPHDSTPEPPSGDNSAYFQLPELGLVRAHFEILQRIQKSVKTRTISVWDPHSVSPFYREEPLSPSNLPATEILPPNFRPTKPQQLIKHHPVFDLLPWPAVRSRILTILSTPVETRPSWVRDEPANVVTKFVLDMRDPNGGLRVWGNDAFDEGNWEVGQTFYDRWGWALDQDVVQRSNEIRRMRGERPLRMTEGLRNGYEK